MPTLKMNYTMPTLKMNYASKAKLVGAVNGLSANYSGNRQKFSFLGMEVIISHEIMDDQFAIVNNGRELKFGIKLHDLADKSWLDALTEKALQGYYLLDRRALGPPSKAQAIAAWVEQIQ